MISRRTLLSGLAAAAAVAAFGRWGRRGAPDAIGPCAPLAGKRIRWIVPNAPGGLYDAESRLVEPYLEGRIRAEIVIDNVAAAGGIAGARAIATAAPNGLTMGIVGVPGLLVAALTGETLAPNPATDFTILGRVARSWHIWATGTRSPFRTFDDVVAQAGKRAIAFALTEVSSASFVSITVSAALAGVKVDLVTGFSSARDAALAAMRGEVDMICFNFDTIVDLIEAGDLRPLLQISARPISSHASLQAVALLGGDAGVAVSQARALGHDAQQARTQSGVLIDVMSTGRLIVAPPHLQDDLFRCLEGGLHDALADPALRAMAGARLDPARGDVTRDEVRAAAAAAHLLVPIVRSAMRTVRQ